jgi:hypothetical protein
MQRRESQTSVGRLALVNLSNLVMFFEVFLEGLLYLLLDIVLLFR